MLQISCFVSFFSSHTKKGLMILALPAVAAKKLKQPCRLTLMRRDDLIVSTKRGETQARWKVVRKEKETFFFFC